jgi:hypothetical protein
MARNADFFEIFKNNMSAAAASNRLSSRGGNAFFDDLLLDPEFDELVDFAGTEAESHLFRETDDLPEAFQ